MNQTRYCSTCGALLPDGAAVCGECGARYLASPYERRATDAPVAWSQAPRARSRELEDPAGAPEEEDGIQLISREDLDPKAPGATTLRPADQYDRRMVTQPGMQPGASQSVPPAYGSPVPGSAPSASAPPGAGGERAALEPPLDGCVPAPAGKRVLAAIVDGVLESVIMAPLLVGLGLILFSQSGSTLAAVLTGVGVAVPVAYAVVMIWLQGAKGFTLGKLALGLRTTRLSAGGGIGFVRSLGRGVLYHLFPLLFALSVFLDPRGWLRGFHDRAIDSVVVDAKAGRNPLRPRADDFARRSDEEYLGAPSVAVDAHDNLMSTPGAAWAGQDHAAAQDQAGASSASAAPEAGDPWGPPPAAPQQQAAPAAGDPSSAPPAPPVEPAPSWGPPPAPEQPAPSAEPAQGWAPPPAPEQPVESAPSWGPPPAAEQPPAPVEPAPSWGPPSAPEQPAPSAEPAATWGPPPAAPAAPAPAGQEPAAADQPEITGDAWNSAAGADEVDEQTRMSAPVQDDLGDLEATRISAVSLPPVRRARITVDDGSARTVERIVVIGRNPGTEQGEESIVLPDQTRSVSKTHLRLDPTGEEITVEDLGSTNGSALLLEDGTREALAPHTATVVPAGARVTLGDRWLTVEREQ